MAGPVSTKPGTAYSRDTEPMTQVSRPPKAGWWRFFLATAVAVLVGLFAAGTASATTRSEVETRVGASTPATVHVVGVHESVSAETTAGCGVAANTVKLTGASGVRALSPGAVAVGENGWSGVGRALAKFLTELALSRALPVLERGRAGTPATWQDLSVYRLPSSQGAASTADGTFVGLR